MRPQEYKKWKPEIDGAVANVCLDIIKEPLTYFSEADVQQLLVEELRKIKAIGKAYPTSVPRGKSSKGTYRTSLIHREYGGGGGGTRIDVVVFDPDDVAKINKVNLTIGPNYLRPAFAFELGTEKTTDAADHFESDLDKLSKRIKGTGYIIHFYKDTTQARTKTRSRQKTEKKIETKFKKIFEARQELKIANIKILAILLRTYRQQKKMRGKCEIFNGEAWAKVNISRDSSLRDAILQQLT
jgi:hypothetical protein